jgi:hypothetical protein
MRYFHDIGSALDHVAEQLKPVVEPPPPLPIRIPSSPVVNSTIKLKPVDKTAALVVSKAPYWAHPPAPPPKFVEPRITAPAVKIPGLKPANRKPKKKKKMSREFKNGKEYESGLGLKPVGWEGDEPLYSAEDCEDLLVTLSDELPAKTKDRVKAAKEARQVVYDLVMGLRDDMAKFEADAKLHVEAIRAKRMFMVTETAQIGNALREIRQFFMGSDYKEEQARLKEFVELCERLQALKQSGFLDSIADTMLTLAIKND